MVGGRSRDGGNGGPHADRVHRCGLPWTGGACAVNRSPRVAQRLARAHRRDLLPRAPRFVSTEEGHDVRNAIPYEGVPFYSGGTSRPALSNVSLALEEG